VTLERPKCPIVVLISGRGTNMRVLIEHSRRPAASYTVAAVVSDKPDAPGLAAAVSLGVPAHALDAGKSADRAAYDELLGDAIAQYSPALIVLAGFMRILSPGFVQRFEGRILNIHPALLPRYPGLHTHRRVLAAGEREHGVTVHYVTAELDGGPRVLQAALAIDANDDESQLAARVQVLEHQIYPLAVCWHCEGRLRYVDGAAWFDSAVLKEPLQLTDLTVT
jgi:phosphoribosylglycinamide formyltransferase-1